MTRFLFSFALIWLAAASAWADAGPTLWSRVAPPIFSHLVAADGLPYPAALAVAEDGEGFIWVATPGGVARWDGYRMRVFRHNEANPASLPENTVMNMLADERGRLWLATASGLVARHDESIQGFVTYRDHGNGLGPLHGLASDRKGGLWAAGRSGLAHLNGDSGIWTWEESSRAAIPGGQVGGILLDRAGRLVIGTPKGLMRRNVEHGPFEPLTMPEELKGDMVTAFLEDRAGTIWFGTRKGQVGTLDPKGHGVRLETGLVPSRQSITAMVEPEPGTLWIAEFGGGIRQFRPGTGEVARFVHDAAAAPSLGDDTVTGMILDRSGMVWASNQRGLDRHIPRNSSVITIVPGGQSGLLGQDVRSVGARADGKLWVGSRAEGLALIDPVAGQVAAFRAGPGPSDLPKERIQAIADTADGNVWLGLANGLYRLDVATGQTHFHAGLGNASIRALHQDHASLWAGGSTGLARLPLGEGAPRLYRNDKDDARSLSDNSASVLFRDRSHRLWVGTWRGLNLLEDAEHGTFRRFLHDASDADSLPSDNVNSIAEDQAGRIWVGTSNGIGILDPAQQGKPRFRRLGVNDGLPNDTVLMLLGGPQGMLAATGDGLSLIDPDTLAMRDFGPADGVAIRTFWAGSGTRMPDGTLIMGGYGGMVVVRPGVPPRRTYVPPLRVTEIRLGGRTLPRNADTVVSPKDRTLRVRFTALDYSAPERINYSYRLDGNDAEWTSADSAHRTAAYNNLSPGTYRLLVRGTNSSGVWNEIPLVQNIRVLPAWYQTAWFRVVAIIAGLGVLIGLGKGRSAYYRHRERELTRQVADRTSEARQAKEEAEAANMVKSRFLAVIGHEIRTPLNGLLGMLQMLEPDQLAADQREMLTIAKSAGNNLRDLVESVLEYGRQDGVIATRNVDIRRLATEVAELFRGQAQAKGLAVSLTVAPPGPLWIRCDQTRLGRVLFNLVGNAIKFTQDGSVQVTVEVTTRGGDTTLSVAVADSGIGIAPEMQEAVFGDFVQGDESITRQFGGVGLGLAICRRIIMQMGGSLTVESAMGVGSVFRLTAPVELGRPDRHAPVADGPPLRVLVVDDDELNRQVALGLLARLGHRGVAVAGGAAAIRAAAAAVFDVVLMDLRMPGMDGMEAARRLRPQAGLRIVAMTADISAEAWRECAVLGMDASLAKPVQLEALRRVLAAAPPGDAAMPVAAPKGRLDEAFLAEQREVLGGRELIRLARLFQRVSRRMVAEIEAAAQAGDRAAMEALAHRLRSAAGPLGLAELAGDAAMVEASAANASPESLIMLAATLCSSRRAGLAALAVIARRS